ncbi:MAG: CvpA family protein [Pseudomonadota bacterium]
MDDLTAFDILFFAAIGLFGILGFARGFVSEVLALFAWVAAIVAVNLFFDEGREMALDFVSDETTAAVLSVLALFVGTFFIGRLLARALGGRVRNSVIGPIDRILGLGFGAAKGLLLAALAWMLLTLTFDIVPGERPAWLADARAGPLLSVLAHEVSDFVADRREDRAIREAAGYTDEERGAFDDLLDRAR